MTDSNGGSLQKSLSSPDTNTHENDNSSDSNIKELIDNDVESWALSSDIGSNIVNLNEESNELKSSGNNHIPKSHSLEKKHEEIKEKFRKPPEKTARFMSYHRISNTILFEKKVYNSVKDSMIQFKEILKSLFENELISKKLSEMSVTSEFIGDCSYNFYSENIPFSSELWLYEGGIHNEMFEKHKIKVRHGPGCLVKQDGTTYLSIFKHGLMSDKTVKITKNGYCEIGNYERNK